MANIPKMSVKFRTRHKDKESYQRYLQLNRPPFNIIVSYNKKKLSIPCAFRCRVIPSWDIFQQLNADGLPKDTVNTNPQVTKCSDLLQVTKRTYLATLEKAVKEGVWDSMNVEGFICYLLENRDEIDKVVRYRRKW